MEDLPQSCVAGESDVRKSLIEAVDRTAIHFLVRPVAAVHSDDGRLVAIELGIRPGTAECFSPVGGKPLHMLRVEAVAEGVADYVVGHYPTMPGLGQATEAIIAPSRFEYSGHVSDDGHGPAAAQDDGSVGRC